MHCMGDFEGRRSPHLFDGGMAMSEAPSGRCPESQPYPLTVNRRGGFSGGGGGQGLGVGSLLVSPG